MALEDLTPAVRVESILNGDEITPANRLEYFLQKAATELPKVAAADAGKVLTVNEDGDGVEWAATMPIDFIVRVDTNEGVYVSSTTKYMADVDYLKNKIDNNIPINGYAYQVDADFPNKTTIYSSVIAGVKEIDGEDIFYDIDLRSTINFSSTFHFGYSLNTLEWWAD